MKDFLVSMLSKGGISSKRVWGSVILAMLCCAYLYCVHDHAEMPDATYGFLSLAGVLLGIETVFSTNKGKKNYEQE